MVSFFVKGGGKNSSLRVCIPRRYRLSDVLTTELNLNGKYKKAKSMNFLLCFIDKLPMII